MHTSEGGKLYATLQNVSTSPSTSPSSSFPYSSDSQSSLGSEDSSTHIVQTNFDLSNQFQQVNINESAQQTAVINTPGPNFPVSPYPIIFCPSINPSSSSAGNNEQPSGSRRKEASKRKRTAKEQQDRDKANEASRKSRLKRKATEACLKEENGKKDIEIARLNGILDGILKTCTCRRKKKYT